MAEPLREDGRWVGPQSEWYDSRAFRFSRVAPQEHAPQERPLSASPLFSARYGYGWPRDFTLPHVEDEDD